MTRRTLALAFVAALLGGCFASAPSAPRSDGAMPSPVGAAASIPWTLDSCKVAVISVPVPSASVAPFLPKGFAPQPISAASATTFFGAEAFRCKSGSGLRGNVTDLSYASFWATVIPPAKLATKGVTQYYVKWDTLVPDDARREALVAAGFPARSGSASVTIDATGAVTGQAHLEYAGDLTIQGVAAGSQPNAAATFVEFTPTLDGFVGAWAATSAASTDALGPGTLTVAAGSVAAKILGGTTAAGGLDVSTWTFHDGNITLALPTS